jgi:MFS family permease
MTEVVDAAVRARPKNRGTFASLTNRNFRLYFIGQGISTAGMFMQTVGQSWLVLKLTGSGTALGVVTALQYLPLLLLGGYAGVIVDRYDRRRLYIITQTISMILAFVLGVLTLTGVVELWMVYTLAFALGLVTTLDQPVRQTFVYDLVGPDQITNGISLQVALSSMSRAIGPAVAGATIALFGIGQCFIANAVTFVFSIGALIMIDPTKMHPPPPQPPRKGQFRQGLRYVVRTPDILALLVLTALFFGLAWEYDVAVPLVARYTFDGGAGLYGFMSSIMGIGAIVAGLLVARVPVATDRLLVLSALGLGVSMLAAAIAPTLWLCVLMLGLAGATSASLASACNSQTQLKSAPEMRGRVMALWAVGALGVRPIGGPVIGYAGQHIGPRAGLALGGIGALLALACWWLIRKLPVRATADV